MAGRIDNMPAAVEHLPLARWQSCTRTFCSSMPWPVLPLRSRMEGRPTGRRFFFSGRPWSGGVGNRCHCGGLLSGWSTTSYSMMLPVRPICKACLRNEAYFSLTLITEQHPLGSTCFCKLFRAIGGFCSSSRGYDHRVGCWRIIALRKELQLRAVNDIFLL